MAQSSVTDKIMLGVWFALLLFYFQESPLKKQPRKAVFFQTQRKMALSLTFIKGLDKTNLHTNDASFDFHDICPSIHSTTDLGLYKTESHLAKLLIQSSRCRQRQTCIGIYFLELTPELHNADGNSVSIL